jgi:hypothetical protein
MIHLKSLDQEPPSPFGLHVDPDVMNGMLPKPKRKYVLQRPKAFPGKGNYGARVLTLEQLHRLALERKCVFCPHARCFQMRTPAAWMMNLQALTVLQLIRSGMFEYVPAKTPKAAV